MCGRRPKNSSTVLPHQRHARRTADQHNFLDFGGSELRVRQRLPHRSHGAVHDRANQPVVFRARDFAEIYAAIGQREFHGCLVGLGKLVLGGDQRLAQFLHGFRMRGKVHSLRANFLARHALQRVVNIVAAQMRVAVGRKHLINIALGGGNQLENRNVKRAAAKIVHGDAAALFLVQAVGQRRRGRLIHQAQDFEPRQPPGIARGLALRVIEISRHGDHGAVHHVLKIFVGPALQLAQDERGNFRRREHAIAQTHANHILAGRIDAERKNLQFVLHVGRAAPHQALHRIDGALRLRQQTAPRGLADDDRAVRVHADHRRTQRRAVRARNTLRPAFALVLIGDQAVGGAEIDADGRAHVCVAPVM